MAADELLVAPDELLIAVDELLIAADELLVAPDELLVAADELLIAADGILVAGDDLAAEFCSRHAGPVTDISKRNRVQPRWLARGPVEHVILQLVQPCCGSRWTARGPQAWDTDITSTLLMLTRVGAVATHTTISATSSASSGWVP